MSEPDEGETKVRAALHRLGARPAGHAPADHAEQQPAPVAVVIPPRPEYQPTVGVPGPRRVLAPRLPDWRDLHKPELDVVDDEPEDADDASEDVEDEPEEQPAESRRRRLLRLVKGERDVSDDGAEQRPPQLRKVSKEPAADQGEEPEDDGEEDLDEVRRVGEGRGGKGRVTVPSGYRRPRFTTPAIPRPEKERKSFAQAWREIDPATKWGLYHVSGLVGGLAFGVVSFATDVTRSVAESPLPLGENPDAYFWTAGAVLVLAVDRVTRRWAWLVGWCTRGVTTSLIVGALLHGNTVGDALSNMPTLP